MRSSKEHFEYRFQHAFNKIQWHVPEDIKTGKFVDIGCGVGNGVAAASKHGSSLSVGIDRAMSEFKNIFNFSDFPSLCRLMGGVPEKCIFMESDIFDVNFPGEQFDYAMMLDSAEHVPSPERFFKWAASALKPGGYFVVDTCPLYYSKVGSHLWDYFSPDTDPWAHLKPGFEQRCEALEIDEWTMQRFHELNRVTHDQLRASFEKAGFDIVQEHQSVPTKEDEKLLALHIDEIDPSVPKDCLFEDWILLVGVLR